MLRTLCQFLLPTLLAITPGLLAAAPTAELVDVQGAYVRATPPGSPNSAAFMQLNNTSASDRALVGAASDIAKSVELHTHLKQNGMMMMRRVEQIALTATTMTQLKPGGLHVMLIGLKRPLSVGEKIAITLQFEDGSHKEIHAPVKKIGAMMRHMMKGAH